MNTYRVRYARLAGDNLVPDTLVEADRFDASSGGRWWRFWRGEEMVAVVPDEKLLIIQKEETVDA